MTAIVVGVQVLCMSPVGDKLSSRCRKFPGLINCTTVDWFLAWPEEGLLNVSQKFISEVPSNAFSSLPPPPPPCLCFFLPIAFVGIVLSL
jgi:hypothetical protein